jgi:hypothetical protein
MGSRAESGSAAGAMNGDRAEPLELPAARPAFRRIDRAGP